MLKRWLKSEPTHDNFLSTRDNFLSTRDNLLSTRDNFLSTHANLLSTRDNFLSIHDNLLKPNVYGYRLVFEFNFTFFRIRFPPKGAWSFCLFKSFKGHHSTEFSGWRSRECTRWIVLSVRWIRGRRLMVRHILFVEGSEMTTGQTGRG